MDKKMMTVAEAGRLGGRKTASTHGREFYEAIGRKGGQKIVAERGSNFFSEIGKEGGTERAKQHERVKRSPRQSQLRGSRSSRRATS